LSQALGICLVENEWVREWTLLKTTRRKCVKVFCQINGCLATKDNCDSWGMCTTSVECKTIITVMLTVMSGMDPHTIRVTWVGMVGMLGVGQS
jgi:hypothetical protein